MGQYGGLLITASGGCAAVKGNNIMNFGEMKTTFLNYTGITDGEVEETDLAIWFNEAQLDLAYDFGEIENQVYEDVKLNEKYALPQTALQLLDIGSEYTITEDNKIQFANEGENTLYFRAIPPSFTGLEEEQTSTLHSALHYLIPIFAASRYWDKESEGDSEESTHATKWMNYYLQGKATALAKLSVANNINKVDRWIII